MYNTNTSFILLIFFRSLMETTLMKGRQLRPSGKWGFYGFPRCFNYEKGEKTCANDTVIYNDR